MNLSENMRVHNTKEEEHKTEHGVYSKNNPSCFQNVKQYFYEYCEKTSMHGFNLLGERGRTIPERIYWIIVITIASYLAVLLVYRAYKDWLNSPVIVTFATSQLGVWDIPFPALTICPQVKSKQDQFNYTDIYLKRENGEELTEIEMKEFEYMSLLCSGAFEVEFNQSEGNTSDEKAIEFLKKVAPNLTELVLHARWLGKEYSGENLTKLFSPIFTSEGMCYTFNNIHRSEIFTNAVTFNDDDYYTAPCEQSEWSMEFGYADESEIFSSCPRRTISAGMKGGLELMLFTYHLNIDYMCREDLLQGYKVILHHPAEIPRAEVGYFYVPLDQSVVVALPCEGRTM